MTSVADRAIVEKGPAAWDKGALVFFALLLLLCLAIFRDYGISFDERLNDSQGRSIIAYYATGFADRRAQAETIDNQYGFIFDIAANLLGPSLPFEHYQARHLLNALVGILGVLGCWRLARYLFDARAALLGAVSLALVPSYFGHAFMNPKDIPFAAGYVWSIYFLLRCLAALPRVPWPSSLSFGATWGLALAVKVPAAMIGIYLMLGAGAMLWLRHRRDPGLRMPALLAAAAGRLLPSLAIAYAVMIASWPWAQLDPLGNPLRALRTFAHFPQWGSEVTLAGARYPHDRVPRSYLPIYFAVKLPEFMLAALAMALPMAAARWRRAAANPEQALLIAVVALSAALPVALQIAMGSLVYNDIRQFLFVLPPLAALLGAVLGQGLDWLQRQPMALRGIAGCLAALYAAYHLSLMVRLHPYQHIYFNRLAGGLSGAAGRFDVELWGTSQREGVMALASYLQARGREGREVTVAVCPWPGQARFYFPPHMRAPAAGEQPDFLILFPGRPHDKCLPFEAGSRPVAALTRLGVPLEVVREVEPAPASR